MTPPPKTRPAERGAYSGMLDILRFNRGQYWTAAVCLAVIALAEAALSLPAFLREGLWFAFGLIAGWSAASLLVSHWVYDRSDLMGLRWMAQLLPKAPQTILVLHAGVDDSSERLRCNHPGAEITTADFFCSGAMTEASILRARDLTGTTGGTGVDFRRLPFAANRFDLVTLIFAAHELRSAEQRRALLREAARVAGHDGVVLLVEHLRDLANFAAFGPGFLHFHGVGVWREDMAAADLTVAGEARKTPFVRAFILRKKP